MPAVRQTIFHGTLKPASAGALLAFRRCFAATTAGFSPSEAAFAAVRAILALYGVAFLTNLTLSY